MIRAFILYWVAHSARIKRVGPADQKTGLGVHFGDGFAICSWCAFVSFQGINDTKVSSQHDTRIPDE